MQKPPQKTSPFREPPLRQAGQSVQEELDRIYEGRGMLYAMYIAFAAVSVISAWIDYVWPSIRNPWYTTAAWVVVVLYSIRGIRKTNKIMKDLRLGRDGEKIVGQLLETLRADGSSVVFHDIIGNGFNVDHVVVSPKGIFAIETKACSKPAGRNPVVTYNNEMVLINGYKPSRDPVAQAKSCANWIQDVLLQSTGKRFPVRPVVLFPEWYVMPPEPRSYQDVWVLNHKAFSSFFNNEKVVLPTEDVKMATYHMSWHISTTL